MAEKYDELQKQMKDKSVDPAKYLPRVSEEIKKDDSKEFAKACKYELMDDIIDRVKAAKNKHEKLMVELCIEYMKKKTQKYYELAKEIFDEKAVVRWKGHEEAIEQMIRILEEPIEWEPTDREKENIHEKHVSWDNQGRALKDAVEKMIEACRLEILRIWQTLVEGIFPLRRGNIYTARGANNYVSLPPISQTFTTIL
eukprot:XP_011667915.1 PREDICTED: uncharacterized protein LOC105439997 [Strongylocentrotus purpuratus]